MNLTTNIERRDPAATLNDLIASLGPWIVLRAALRALVRRRPRQVYFEHDLPDRLRRDIGLPVTDRIIQHRNYLM